MARELAGMAGGAEGNFLIAEKTRRVAELGVGALAVTLLALNS